MSTRRCLLLLLRQEIERHVVVEKADVMCLLPSEQQAMQCILQDNAAASDWKNSLALLCKLLTLHHKQAPDADALETAAQAGLQQVVQQRYASVFHDHPVSDRFAVAIAFHGKQAVMKYERQAPLGKQL